MISSESDEYNEANGKNHNSDEESEEIDIQVVNIGDGNQGNL